MELVIIICTSVICNFVQQLDNSTRVLITAFSSGNVSCTICMCVTHCSLSVYLQVKCTQYWPINGTVIYGGVKVTLEHIVELPDYTIRNLSVSSVSQSIH